jgi:signal peptidase I
MTQSWWFAASVRLRKALRRHDAGERARLVWDYAKEPLLIFGVVYMCAAAVAQPFYVPSGSMQPTLGIGDFLIATKFSYGFDRYSLPFASGPTPTQQFFARQPEVGDVVVFRKPGHESLTLVKRVIGQPGDRLQMKSGRLWINGKELALRPDGIGHAENGPTEDTPGTYLDVYRFVETLPNGREHPIFKKGWSGYYDDTPEYVVPAGHLFVMGDNRDDSADSRVPIEGNGVGFLPAANVMGRARVVLASVDFVNAAGIWEWPLNLRKERTLRQVR